MMNALSCRKLFLAVAGSMNSILTCKLVRIHPFPFHFGNVYSSIPFSQTLFSQFASTKLNLSEAAITRILKSTPKLRNLQTLDKAEKNIHLLKQHGCTEVQIAKIMTRYPRFLCGSFDKTILSRMEFLKNVFQSQDALAKALVKAPRLLTYSLEQTLKPSLAYWKGWSFPGTELVSFLQIYPIILTRTSLNPAQVGLINKIVADKKSNMYKYIVATVATSRTETVEAKIENLKLWGLSAEEIWQLLGAFPLLFTLSKENVREKMNFLVNNLELRANCVVKHPILLRISLEKTMRPRFLVWQKIKSINDHNLSSLKVLWMPEAKFVSKILEGHPESKTLWRIYESALSQTSNRTKSSSKNNVLDNKVRIRNQKTLCNL